MASTALLGSSWKTMALEAMSYGTMEAVVRERRRTDPVKTGVRMALGGLVAVTCLAGVMIVSWSHVVDRAVELADKSSAAEGGLVSEIGKYNVAGRLLKDRRAVQSLSAQYKQAQKDLKKQSLMLQPSPASDLSGKLQQAKNALEKTTDEV
eukprot:2611300-Rhodomonas_salina.1